MENFELPIRNLSSALLIGRNGAGKTTVGLCLGILQQIARGKNRVGDLIRSEDFTRGQTEIPIRIEIEAELGGKRFAYAIAFEFPSGFKEPRVFEEKLDSDGAPVYARENAQVKLFREKGEAKFMIDWHQVALPIVQEASTKDPLFTFKQWLQRMVILQPIPGLISGESTEGGTLEPTRDATNLGDWFSGLIGYAPAAYSDIEAFLKDLMPDFRDLKNPIIGKDSRSLFVQFSNEPKGLTVPFSDLSDGEKCFLICAVTLAANRAYGPLFCFWDEPDSYLSISEVGHFVTSLRKVFQNGGQFICTSHNPETIRSFSDENTLALVRKSHSEPAMVRPLDSMREEGRIPGDIVNSLIRGDLEEWA